MTDVEVATLFLQMFEGLDILAEQMDLFVSAFGEQEAILSVYPPVEANWDESEAGSPG